MFLPLFVLTALSTAPVGFAVERVAVEAAGVRAELAFVKGPKTDVSLEVYQGGKLRQTFPHLGEDLAPITKDGADHPLQLLRLNPESPVAVLRTTQPPISGSLWVFRWDSSKRAFAIVKREKGDHYIPVPLSGKVELTPGGDLSYTLPGSGKKQRLHWNGQDFVQAGGG